MFANLVADSVFSFLNIMWHINAFQSVREPSSSTMSSLVVFVYLPPSVDVFLFAGINVASFSSSIVTDTSTIVYIVLPLMLYSASSRPY